MACFACAVLVLEFMTSSLETKIYMTEMNRGGRIKDDSDVEADDENVVLGLMIVKGEVDTAEYDGGGCDNKDGGRDIFMTMVVDCATTVLTK